MKGKRHSSLSLFYAETWTGDEGKGAPLYIFSKCVWFGLKSLFGMLCDLSRSYMIDLMFVRHIFILFYTVLLLI